MNSFRPENIFLINLWIMIDVVYIFDSFFASRRQNAHQFPRTTVVLIDRIEHAMTNVLLIPQQKVSRRKFVKQTKKN